MKTTTHKCDRCGKEGNDTLVLDAVTVHVGSHKMISAEWCRECTSSTITGWPLGKDLPRPSVHPTLTIEDILRELMQEVIDEQ